MQFKSNDSDSLDYYITMLLLVLHVHIVINEGLAEQLARAYVHSPSRSLARGPRTVALCACTECAQRSGLQKRFSCCTLF